MSGMDIVSPTGRMFEVRYSSLVELRYATSISRRVLDAALLREAQRAGAELHEGITVKAPIVERVEWSVAFADRTVGSRWKCARRSPSWPTGRDPYWRVDWDSPGRPVGRCAWGWSRTITAARRCGMAPARCTWAHSVTAASPVADGCYNVAAVLRPNALLRGGGAETLDRFIASMPALSGLLSGCRRIEPVRGVSPIGSRSTRAFTGGALLVVSASFFDPFTGEGIFRALAGAELAAQTACAALETGAFSAANLKVYDELRAQTFQTKERVTSIVQLFVRFPGLMEYALPRLSRRGVPAEALNLVLGDVAEAGTFLNPKMLWAALRP